MVLPKVPKALEEAKESSSLALNEEGFSSKRWLAYFQENKKSCPQIVIPATVNIPAAMRPPLIHSLQRFQIGETGEGKHLKKFAARMNDPDYEKCIDMFIKEEQHHARILAQMIAGMDGTLLSWHWSDLVFIALRRLLHLKTEIFVLLIAEVIGKCFYRTCSANLEDPLLSDAFSLIVLDELGHLEFHCGFLRKQFENSPVLVRKFVLLCWSWLFYCACSVFIADHKRALMALNVQPKQFLEDLHTTFRICSRRSLSLEWQEVVEK
ncbi:MAG: hypothetical protein K2Y39_12035 [Candidatus Obscuribacterales bacterium]|nr:hypothetical protein [Candidatus Obscuribacterales bacterium]